MTETHYELPNPRGLTPLVRRAAARAIVAANSANGDPTDERIVRIAEGCELRTATS